MTDEYQLIYVSIIRMVRRIFSDFATSDLCTMNRFDHSAKLVRFKLRTPKSTRGLRSEALAMGP